MSAPAVPAGSTPSLAPPRLTRALLGLLGATVLFGAVYFSLIEPAPAMDAADWLVTAWAFALGAVLLLAGARLGADPRAHRLAVAALAVHVVFGLVKLVGYDEPEAVVIIAADLVLLGLLSRPGLRRAVGR